MSARACGVGASVASGPYTREGGLVQLSQGTNLKLMI